MLSKNRSLRLILFATPALALAAAALFLTLGPSTGDRAQAGSALNFAMGVDFNGDGTNDCGTGAPSAVGDGAPDAVTAGVTNETCNVPTVGAKLQVNVYLMSLGALPNYAGAAASVFYTGVTTNGRGTSLWTGHVFDVTAPPFAPFVIFENAGSAIGVAPAVPQTNLGLMNRFSFACAAGGTLRLDHSPAQTGLTDNFLVEHNEAGPGDTLTVTCGGVVRPTDTPINTPPPVTPPTATNTPLPTTPPAATNTPTRTNTPGPATATRTPTNTPEAPDCDVNGDGLLDAEDALWILWDEADIADVPLPENADCNGDGRVNSIDALFILWMVGGQI